MSNDQQSDALRAKCWSELVTRLEPYVPGEQPQLNNLVKLNTNENPHPPSPAVIAAIQSAVNDDLRLYPPPDASKLKAAVADYYGLSPKQVFAGNGSDEVLAHIFNGLLKHDQPLLFPDITYSFYPVYCRLYDIEFRKIPLREDFAIAVDDYSTSNGGIIFPNPNAPTGRLTPLAEIERLLQGNPDSVVVIDEAYIDFGGDSAVGLIDKYPNLLVVQTLSKSRSLAGLRVGLALGNPALIEALERIKNSFNSYPLSRMAIAGCVAAFADEDYFQATRQQVISQREALIEFMQQRGFEVLPSAANFIFVRHPEFQASELAASLRQRGIVVRHFEHPRIEQFMRITIGSEEQNQSLKEALTELCQGI